MKSTIPSPLQQAQKALHDDLRRSIQASRRVAEPTKSLAGLPHPHVVKFDAMALPRLGRQEVAERSGRSNVATVAHQRVQHAGSQDKVMYPAATLAGRHVRRRLEQHTDQRVAT